MLSDPERAEADDMLLQAGMTRMQAVQPSDRWPQIEIDDAYAISRSFAEARQKRGDRIIGHKVGLTSRAMQTSSKIDEPDEIDLRRLSALLERNGEIEVSRQRGRLACQQAGDFRCRANGRSNGVLVLAPATYETSLQAAPEPAIL